jgi:tRNA(Met) cytidine acetyltransferase
MHDGGDGDGDAAAADDASADGAAGTGDGGERADADGDVDVEVNADGGAGADADLADLGARLRDAARRDDHRRLVVLAGDRRAGRAAARRLLDGAGVPAAAVTAVADAPLDDYGTVAPTATDRLLGTTRTAVVHDVHDRCAPNALGRLAGVVDGGGLLVLLTPPLDEWPARRDAFDEGLAAPPFGVADVAGNFRRRLVGTLREHPGVAVVDVDAGRVVRDGRTTGRTGPPRAGDGPESTVPAGAGFPPAAYRACLTRDQRRAVRALERLASPGNAVVVEADRGRGKSSAAGIAAGSLAAAGRDVLVTAPAAERAREVFVRARSLLTALDALEGARDRGEDGGDAGDDGDPARSPDAGGVDGADEDARTVRARTGGRVWFARPPEAAAVVDAGGADAPDVVLVDEAAAVPVRLLARLLGAPAAGFVTTVHGYEGAGRGFSVRFRDRLDDWPGRVTDVRMEDPIRYARGDPVEAWSFRALALDARPAVDAAVADATPESAAYDALSPADLLADEHLLGEAFGLLVAAHYRTEPDDLARLLDAPNVHVRALRHEGHVASVALLAREGGLDAATRRASYEGARIRGNLLPDVLTSQLRDEDAGAPVGVRVVRIATHAAVRSRGLGSRLLREVAREWGGAGTAGASGRDGTRERGGGPGRARVDWLGVAYGATPELVDFWARNGYETVHLSTTRNESSGEYSALMLRPVSATGRALARRHGRWFCERVGGVLGDALRDLDPDVVRGALGAAAHPPPLDLSPWAWRTVAAAAYGPGLYDVAPGPFRRLVLRHLVDGDADLPPRAERVLVGKALQARSWDRLAAAEGYHSRSECMRAFGRALRPLVDAYGDAAARTERERYADGADGDGRGGGAGRDGGGASDDGRGAGARDGTDATGGDGR